MMSEIAKKGYKGNITYYKNVKYDFEGVTTGSVDENDYLWESGDMVPMGEGYVEIEFTTDTRQAEIEALEKQKQEVRAELAAKLATIDDRISKLMALPGGSSDD